LSRQPGRPKVFCNDKCKQAEFRYARVTPRPFDTKRNEIAQKTQVKPATSKTGFGNRPPPLNLLGNGRRWPDGTSVDSDTLKVIINTEISSTRSSTLTADQQREVARLIDLIPGDLSIPEFLKR
jgi:hypothetical protein